MPPCLSYAVHFQSPEVEAKSSGVCHFSPDDSLKTPGVYSKAIWVNDFLPYVMLQTLSV